MERQFAAVAVVGRDVTNIDSAGILKKAGGMVRCGIRTIVLLWALLLLASNTRAQGRELSATGGPASSTIYVVRRGWHIDVGLPIGETTVPLSALASGFPSVQYLFFGFGDRRYLMAKHGSTPAMLGALWPGKAVILITGLSASPTEAFGNTHVIRLRVTPAQSLAAQGFIWRSLADTLAEGVPGPYPGSLYVNAQARYSALHTCNTWAAEVLDNAGLPLHSAGVLFAGQVWKRAQRLATTE